MCLFFLCVIPLVCIRLMGRVIQSVTQLSISNRWYVLDQRNYMFRPIEAIIRFVQVELWEWYTVINIMCTTAYQW